MELSSKKNKAYMENIEAHLDIINQLKQSFDSKLFEVTFEKLSTIWYAFLLHIIDSEIYPIFDQHVYRAYSYIHNIEVKEIPLSDKTKRNCYCKEYIPFFRNMLDLADEHSKKDVDNALWIFGKMLKENKNLIENYEM